MASTREPSSPSPSKEVKPLYPEGFYAPPGPQGSNLGVYLRSLRKGGIVTKEQGIQINKLIDSKIEHKGAYGRFPKAWFKDILPKDCYGIIRNESGTIAILNLKGVEAPLTETTYTRGGIKLGWHIEKEEWVVVKTQNYTEKKRSLDLEEENLEDLGQLYGKPVTRMSAKHGYQKHNIVMKYIVGNNLGSVLPRKPQLPAAQLLDIAIAMCEYLKNEIHNKGLFHCDIKPDNTMLDQITGTVVINDYGVSVKRPMVNGEYLDTVDITYRGTRGYISPNFSLGFENGRTVPYTAKDDVFSLGETFKNLFDSQESYIDFAIESAVGSEAFGNSELTNFLESMSADSPDDRPDLDKCIETLQSIRQRYLNTTQGLQSRIAAERLQKAAQQAEIERLNAVYLDAIHASLENNNIPQLIEDITLTGLINILPYLDKQKAGEPLYRYLCNRMDAINQRLLELYKNKQTFKYLVSEIEELMMLEKQYAEVIGPTYLSFQLKRLNEIALSKLDEVIRDGKKVTFKKDDAQKLSKLFLIFENPLAKKAVWADSDEFKNYKNSYMTDLKNDLQNKIKYIGFKEDTTSCFETQKTYLNLIDFIWFKHNFSKDNMSSTELYDESLDLVDRMKMLQSLTPLVNVLFGNKGGDSIASKIADIIKVLNLQIAKLEKNEEVQAKIFLENAERTLKEKWKKNIPTYVQLQLKEIERGKKDGNYIKHKDNFIKIGVKKATSWYLRSKTDEERNYFKLFKDKTPSAVEQDLKSKFQQKKLELTKITK